MPPHVVEEPVEVLLELPREARLAHSGGADDRQRGGRCRSSDGGVEELLREAKLALAPDERRLEADRPALAAAVCDDAQRAPELHRLGLALELALAGRRIGDRRLGRPVRRLADEHGAGRRGGLDARRGVDEVAGDHPLALGSDRDRGLAGEHSCTERSSAPDRGHRGDGVDELERRPHGPLGVVLVSRPARPRPP